MSPRYVAARLAPGGASARYRVGMHVQRSGAVLMLALVALALAGCADDKNDASNTPEPSTNDSPAATESASPTPTENARPSSEPTTIDLPTDCRVILSDSVLADLDDVPLNDPAFGTSGVLDDGSLRCIWGDPAADTTSLSTDIYGISQVEAIDMLNELADDEDFTCYSPDAGVRCEKTWTDENYPVTDGRTLYWRDGVMIDTQYSNLAPDGYTSSIVDHIFPKSTASPSPSPTTS
ncbi:MAG: hypothetical protein QM607_06420 [Microbacterium sp.]